MMTHARVIRLGGAACGLTLITLAACTSTPRASDPEVTTRAVNVALSMQGKPYRYGGNTPAGFDCSGLIQYSYARAGVRLPRSTEQLWSRSRTIARRHLQPGDLIFFNQEGKRSSHVAIYVGNDRFVHAPSSGKHVSVANFTDPYWRRNFASARRIEIN
jgi:murein DD-endopeptidase